MRTICRHRTARTRKRSSRSTASEILSPCGATSPAQSSDAAIQHDHHDVIISALHVHLDHHNCLEVLVVRGKADEIKRIADELIAAKGVKHGKLTVTSTGKDLPT